MWPTYSVIAIILLWAIAMVVAARQKDWEPPQTLPLWDGVRSPLKNVPITDLREAIGFSKTPPILPILDPHDRQWKMIQPSEEREDTSCTCHTCLDKAAEIGSVVKVYGDEGVVDYFFVAR